jgi:7-cyano-7-deazaguanine synthase
LRPMVPVVLLSGGFDSATVLAAMRDQGQQSSALFVDLGQPAREEERRASAAVARHYETPCRELTVHGLVVEEGEVRGRNAILLTLALSAIAPPTTISIGVHEGSGYWDCSSDFVSVAQQLADGYTGGRIQIDAPLIGLAKSDVYALGRALGVPEALTYSCERGGVPPCGRCRSCLDVKAHARA